MSLKQPSPAQILEAREAAGLTQGQAAELVHLAHRPRWTEYENGSRAIDLARWELFLIKTQKVRSASQPRHSTGGENA